jgi:hypothetical protein
MSLIKNIPGTSKSYSMLAMRLIFANGLPLFCQAILPLTCTFFGMLYGYYHQGSFPLLVFFLIHELPNVPMSLVSLLHPTLPHLLEFRRLLHTSNNCAPTQMAADTKMMFTGSEAPHVAPIPPSRVSKAHYIRIFVATGYCSTGSDYTIC